MTEKRVLKILMMAVGQKVEVVLTKKGDEMVVEVGNFKRELTLPAVLTPMDAKVARFVDKNLEIHFEPATVAS